MKLHARIVSAFVWIAAFCLASGVFLSLTLLLKNLPPTAPVAIGVVTIERYSKLRDYVTAALFFLLVPPLTLWLRRVFERATARMNTAAALLFAVPYFFSPIFYLTTGKVGWILGIPIALSLGGPRALAVWQTRGWLRAMFRRELHPYHALLLAEGLSWILFRYIVLSRRIALIAFLIRKPLAPRATWNLAAYLIFPVLIYLVSYASTAQGSQWVDLFHRGEAIGPASDYLRGKVPFRDVFALHGMLEDGLLDAWLMDLFGRSLDVHIARTAIIGAFLGVSLWFLGVVVFDSIPLALFCVAMGSWTTVENNRTLFQVAAVALFWNAVRRRSRASAIFAGVFAGIAIFFSYDIGLYTIAGAIAASLLLWIAAKRAPLAKNSGAAPASGAGTRDDPAAEAAAAPLFFAIGVLLGAAPFVIYLAIRGALDDFAVTSFVVIPRIIDATWALPFPDLVSTFRRDLNLHTLADFVLMEKFHLILSPLTIAVALVYFIQRWSGARLRRAFGREARQKRAPLDQLDYALLVLTVFAAITQRTAFGRAEFRHQYFAAFLIGPMLVLLAVLMVRRLRELWEDEGSRALVVTLVAASLPAMAVLFWIPDLVNARIDDLVRYQARILHLHRDAHAEEVALRIEAVKQAVHELARPGQPIFDFSNQPAFYFFCDRPNPTRFYQVPILSPRAFQRETIVALERARPPDVDAYLRRIRIPLSETGVERSRLVFPTAGSTPGANGSYWRSDLTLHNPHKETLTLDLRYVAGEVRIDRDVVLAGGESARWVDVVRSFFGAPESRGALWIGYRGEHAPVARLKTYDAAHDAKASIDTPLSMRDAATGADLTVVGLPGGGIARRINVGVVNVGTIPATFRITARTAAGKTIGTFYEEGVPEDESRLVSDIETALGVQLDESATLHITPVAGTIVAYATVIGAGGDSEFITAVP